MQSYILSLKPTKKVRFFLKNLPFAIKMKYLDVMIQLAVDYNDFIPQAKFIGRTMR